MIKNVIVLGGYGNFGKRICESLAALSDVRLFIAGRSLSKSDNLRRVLQTEARAELVPLAIDILAANFDQQIKELAPFLVIHTCGPFQGQDYRVPEACIAAGSHYIDLADDRSYVCDIYALDSLAKKNNVFAVSGASSVPGLSSVIIDHLMHYFSRLDGIDIAIAPGNRAERGEATVKAILSYTGHKIRVFDNGVWQTQFGWMNPRKMDFGEVVGQRWLANVDVPDLQLFASRYAPVKSVKFQAGLELPFLHWIMVFMAWIAKKGIVSSWAPWVKPILRLSNFFIGFGTDIGGMKIIMSGLNKEMKTTEVIWQLTAKNGIGPYIPTFAAIILAEQLLMGNNDGLGATPCLGLFSIADFDLHATPLGIYHQTFVGGIEVNSSKNAI